MREIILSRSQKLTDEEMLAKLRALLAQRGRLSGIIIDEAEELPSSASFNHRFGSLVSAYRLIGYDPGIDYDFIDVNRKLRKQHPETVASVIRQIESLGAVATWDATTDLLHLNSELRVSIVLCRHMTTSAGSSRWVIRLDDGIRDYYLLPGIDMTWENLRVAEDNGVYLDAYRFETLDYFLGMAARVKLQEAA